MLTTISASASGETAARSERPVKPKTSIVSIPTTSYGLGSMNTKAPEKPMHQRRAPRTPAHRDAAHAKGEVRRELGELRLRLLASSACVSDQPHTMSARRLSAR